MKKNLGILGSTGSIGVQALEVVREERERFDVKVLTTNKNIELLARQADEFEPDLLVVGEEKLAPELEKYVSHLDVKVEKGRDGLRIASEWQGLDMALVALVGFSGVYPTINAMNNKIDVALANKEALVVAGSILKDISENCDAKIIPVDSEHSAIFQSLLGENNNNIDRLYLTASGGPFFGNKKEDLSEVEPKDALKHPNWDMGSKITIDSATMMNKGLEVIEAYWLFDIPFDRIDIVVHPESIVHSMVELVDGTIKAELGTADMRRPIQFALTYPERQRNSFSKFNIFDKKLEFYPPDYDNFPCIDLAYDAGRAGGTFPCVLNAANEIAVEYFLRNEINFLDIPDIIRLTMEKHKQISNPELEVLYEVDEWSRKQALSIIENKL